MTLARHPAGGGGGSYIRYGDSAVRLLNVYRGGLVIDQPPARDLFKTRGVLLSIPHGMPGSERDKNFVMMDVCVCVDVWMTDVMMDD